MKKVLACCALGLLALGGTAVADIGTIDDVPAATLLVPYFEVDLDDPNGVTTLFSINNASAAATVAHVTIWSDLSVPVLDFDVYLTGYDVQTINLRDILVDGNLPVTADVSADPADTISPQGALSGDADFAATSGPCVSPYRVPQLDATLIGHVQGGLTGNPSALNGFCYGLNYADDSIARGYVTVDNANECSLDFPDAAGYFAAGGTGVASNTNQLFGDWFLVDPANNFAQGEGAVHIEACPGDGSSNDPECDYLTGEYTFYGRYVGFAGTDQREPLGMTFGPRYLNGGAFDTTDYLGWREARASDATAFACGTFPAWYPLNQADAVAFDELENPADLCFQQSEVSPPTGGEDTCFPAETGRYNTVSSAVPGSQSLAPPFDFGWMYLNLSTEPDAPAQAWVEQVHSAFGLFSVGYDSVIFEYVPRSAGSTDGGLLLIP